MPQPQSALGVIKSTAVWLQQLHFECVMYFNNDTAWRQTGLSSRSLSQLIMLLLTTLTGRESSRAACHFSGKGGMSEEMDREKKTERERAASLFSFEFLPCLRVCACVRACTLVYFAVLTVILFCPCEISSAPLCGYVPARPSLHFYRKCLFCPR